MSLREPIFIPIDRRTLILKMVGMEVFLMKPSINKENEFMVPNHEKKRDYCVNLCLSQLTDEL